MISQKELKEVGKFQKTHALKGELNALLDVSPDYVADGNAIVIDIDGIYVPFFASSIRQKGSQSYLVKLDGVDSEEEAKTFVNKSIYALKSEIAPYYGMEEDEIIYGDDLEGFRVVDNDTGQEIGVVTRVDDATENVLLVVADSSANEVYIPAVDDFIDEIDDENREIRVSLPEGLVDLNIKNEKQ